ncbi:MAG TPA: hypothetical protein VF613_06605 [Longimicrobium sp.]
MRRTLSARSTTFYHLLPWAWLLATASVAWMLRGERGLLPMLVIVALVPTLALRWMLGRLRHVSTDGRVLFVASGGKEIAIPFSEIAEVREHRGGRRRAPSVTLRLKTPSDLGEEIRFVPRMRWWPDAQSMAQAQALRDTDPDAAAMALWASYSPAEEIRQRMRLTHEAPAGQPVR